MTGFSTVDAWGDLGGPRVVLHQVDSEPLSRPGISMGVGTVSVHFARGKRDGPGMSLPGGQSSVRRGLRIDHDHRAKRNTNVHRTRRRVRQPSFDE